MKYFACVSVVVAIAACAAACRERAAGNSEKPQDPVAVTVVHATVGPVQREVQIVGTLYGDEEATVSAKVPGRITQIFKDVGDRAAPGEPLAQIEKTDYELAVAQKQMAVQAALAKLGLTELPPADIDFDKIPTVERARLQGANAEAKFNRGNQLHEQTPPLISDQDYADLKTAFDVAKSNYQVELLTARSLVADARARKSDLDLEAQRLRDATIRAPQSDGATTQPAAARYAVAARMVSVGEYVREGTSLFRLVADNPIKYRAQVPERFLSQVKVGQTVRVAVEAYAQAFEGKVSRISPQVDVGTRTFAVEMLIPNPDGKLQPGAFARGAILTVVEPNVTLVPMEALITFAGVTKVFTVENGKAVEKKVETGQRVGDGIEIVSGLSGAAPVVTGGRNKLATGTPVAVSVAGTQGG